MKKGLIFNIQRFSLHDGPGIRTTVFFKGCPLHCQWCQNPEGISQSPVLFCYPNKCLGCRSCLEQCMEEAITIEKTGPVIDRNRCRLCLKCVIVCPVEAIQVAGKEITASELLKEIRKDRFVFEESGGGATFSGGEPLMQAEFIIELLKELKKENIHTVIETSGFAPWPVLEAVAEMTDLILYDLKLIDPVKSIKYTGVSSSVILSNLKQLIESGSQVQVRMPIVPSVNDDQSNLQEVAIILKECGVSELELIPYHILGMAKYTNLNLEYRQAGIAVPSVDQVSGIAVYMEQNGLKIISEAG